MSLRQKSGKNILKALVISPYALLRISALPFHFLTDMALERTWQQLLAASRALSECQAIGNAVADEIHALIPFIEDIALRRALLSLKRAAHGGRMEIRAADLEKVVKALDGLPAAATQVRGWIRFHSEYGAACRAAEESVAIDIDARTRPAMRRALATPAFSYALALSSPRLYERLARHLDFNDGKAATNKSERSLMNYLGRAAAKTSPLSTFMFSAWVRNGGAGQRNSDLNIAHGHMYVVETQLTRGVIARICRYALKDAQQLMGTPVIRNPSLVFTEEKVRAVAHNHVELLGRAWRQERVATFTLPANVASALRQFMRPDCTGTLEQRFVAAGMAPDVARKWIAQLLDRGLVFNAPLWGPQTREPLAALINALRPDSAKGAALRAVLDETGAAVAAINQAGPQEVVALHARIDGLVDRAHSLVGARFCKPFQANLSQNVTLRGVQGGFGSALNELVEELGAELANHITVAHEYAVVLRLFLAHFGPGGVCDNLLAFLVENHADYVEGCAQKPAASVAIADAVLGVTAYVQLLAPGLAEIDAGQARLVANLIYERAGWQAARYLPVDGSGDQRERGMVAAWLRTLAGDAEPVEMSFSGDCNGLQAHPAVTARVLGWPGEGAGAEGETVAIDPRTIRVAHDPVSNRLRFYDGEAREIALMYLGAVMPMPSWGISHMLIKMAEPLAIQRPDHLLGQHGRGGQVVAQPRISEGRVTLFRASWLVDAATIGALLAHPGYVEQIRAMQGFFSEHGMPRFSYVNADIAYSATDAQRLNLDRLRKPTWFDIANPVCLDLLRRLCAQADNLTFREALPGEADLWLQMGADRHVSEIQVELKIQMSLP